MPLAQDIRGLVDRTLSLMDSAHDYYYHSQALWRTFQIEVLREGRKGTVRNPTTGRTVNEQDLVALAKPYTTKYLPSAALQQCVSLLESFMTDLLRLWLTQYPGSLKRKTLDFSEVLGAPDKPTLVQSIIDKTVNDVAYRSIRDWFAYLEGIAHLGCPSEDEIVRLAEVKASRDVLVHNQGVVNSIYRDRAGGLARFPAGQSLEISEPYLNDAFLLVRKILTDLSRAASEKAQSPS